MPPDPPWTRRRWLAAIGAATGGVSACTTPLGHVFPTAIGEPRFALEPTPASRCEQATPEVVEGPFFTPASPEREWITDADGADLVLRGRVVDASCRPVEGAVLDFWQADASGRYDLDGQRHRGHQFATRGGLYRLVTVVPGPEAVLGIERAPHIHVKVQAPGGPLLTTQLYFAHEAERNARDAYFDARTVITREAGRPLATARFDFVIAR